MGCIIRAARSGEINVILHCANCFHTMGAGVARAIKDEWPGAFQADLKTPRGDRSKMGTFSFHQEGKLVVINLYGQYRYSTDCGSSLWSTPPCGGHSALRQSG